MRRWKRNYWLFWMYGYNIFIYHIGKVQRDAMYFWGISNMLLWPPGPYTIIVATMLLSPLLLLVLLPSNSFCCLCIFCSWRPCQCWLSCYYRCPCCSFHNWGQSCCMQMCWGGLRIYCCWRSRCICSFCCLCCSCCHTVGGVPFFCWRTYFAGVPAFASLISDQCC